MKEKLHLNYRTMMFAFLLVSTLALVLIPVIPLDRSNAVDCGGSRMPCPLLPDYFYWSITAYFLGVGAYLAPYGYGFMGSPMVYSALIFALLVPVIGLVSSLRRRPENRPSSQIVSNPRSRWERKSMGFRSLVSICEN